MFGRLLNRNADRGSAKRSECEVVFAESGVSYVASGVSVSEWLAAPFLYPEIADKGALLAQLFTEGYGSRKDDSFLLPWTDLYQLLRSEDYQTSLGALELPAVSSFRPVLSSSGSLQDSDFSVVLSGWQGEDGAPLRSTPKITGAVLQLQGQSLLMPEPVWRLVSLVREFHQRPESERTPDSNRAHWGRIRKEALVADAGLSNFLQKTIVLTPEKLRLGLRKTGEGEGKTVEVTPGFEGAPSRWVEIFDRMPGVNDRYEIPDGEELVHVVVSPQVKTVLAEIKRMPGRRVSGSRAEAFVRNPFALLGPDADAVIEPAIFEADRAEAGLGFERFSPLLLRSGDGQIERVGLLIESCVGDQIETDEEFFGTDDDLHAFVSKLEGRIAADAQCCFWNGYELEILGETPEHLKLLKQILAEWTAPTRISLADIFDLSHYSERIEGVGQEKPYFSPFIARKQEDSGWVPENVIFGFQFLPEGETEPVTVPMNDERLADLKQMIADAEETGREAVVLPGCPRPIPLKDAKELVASIGAASDDVKAGKLRDPAAAPKHAVERKHLIVKANIDTVDYAEQRAELLSLRDDAEPHLPRSLRPDVSLKEHQRYGLAWMQHLWRLSPTHCRGALLADDMGLGKTIQLLSLIASCLEFEPAMDPVLVVAPVALLENWKEETDKFFLPGALPVLTLYGDSLASKQIAKRQLGEEFAEAGITKLLKKGWVGDAKVVLTTYETLRSLEFSLAAQRWSMMICDEAQKIKNPNAMVTRAAKKQNVRFRIACTGTPVENTLTDIWCLFDFIQPGLLGALSEFGRRYRKPIEAETEEEKKRVEELRAIIKPQMLRREKKDVAKDLPAKTEDLKCRALPISDHQRALYGRGLAAYRKQQGAAAAQLGFIHFIRRVCSDPFVDDPYQADRTSVADIMCLSPKMAWLLDALRAIRQRGEKAIVFCEFRDLQRTLQRCIAHALDVHPDIINGDTSASSASADSRQKRIKAFQSKPGFGVIVLSPLAVGFGVNIQAANHVIHFTRTWNPAKEDQATDRAYRIGQEREVFVYYPIVVAEDFVTFDQKLHQLLDWKRGLSSDMLNGTGEISVAEFLGGEDRVDA